MSQTAESLWAAAESEGVRFIAARDTLPASARLYLDHAIKPGTSLAEAVKLRMHGEMRLKGWAPFTAEETICVGRGMVWSARTKIGGLPIEGFDEIVEGEARSEWRLFGLVPVARTHGPDVDRSCAGRMVAESVCNPSALLRDDVVGAGTHRFEARFLMTVFGHPTEVRLTLSELGKIETIQLSRWRNPAGLPYGLYSFGGFVEEDKDLRRLHDPFSPPIRMALRNRPIREGGRVLPHDDRRRDV